MMFVAVFTIIGYIFVQPVLFSQFPVYDPINLGYLSFDLLIALAYSGFMLNLFNLIPVSPLDGGRITAIISPRVWLLGVPILIALFLFLDLGIEPAEEEDENEDETAGAATAWTPRGCWTRTTRTKARKHWGF